MYNLLVMSNIQDNIGKLEADAKGKKEDLSLKMATESQVAMELQIARQSLQTKEQELRNAQLQLELEKQKKSQPPQPVTATYKDVVEGRSNVMEQNHDAIEEVQRLEAKVKSAYLRETMEGVADSTKFIHVAVAGCASVC